MDNNPLVSSDFFTHGSSLLHLVIWMKGFELELKSDTDLPLNSATR